MSCFRPPVHAPGAIAAPQPSRLASCEPRLANLGLPMTLKRCLRSGLRCMPDGTVEIITGKERRRRWSVEEKPRIVAEAEEPGVRIAEVAARHEVYPSLLFNGRRQVREGRLGPRCPSQFVPVHLIYSDSSGIRETPLLVHLVGSRNPVRLSHTVRGRPFMVQRNGLAMV
jgi:transposase-like protein